MTHILTKEREYPTAESLQQGRSEPKPEDATPMMRQYWEIKNAYPDYLLFYRMGDFYELFFDDALAASEILDITLTRRGKHLGQDIPMCGVPFHSYESYLEKLITHGKKVAICEQTEDPVEARKRGAKSVVKREVIRVVTPGTLTEENLLDARESNYLLALVPGKETCALAWCDISTGDFRFTECPLQEARAELSRLNPKEILAPDAVLSDKSLAWLEADYRTRLTTFVGDFFALEKAGRRVQAFFGVATLAAMEFDGDSAIAACGSLLEYLELTQLEHKPRLDLPRKHHAPDHMVIDAATRRNLELSRTLAGEYKGSLLATINRTATGAGTRLLAHFLHAPLLNVNEINRRLDAVAYFDREAQCARQVRQALRQTPDMERALSRLAIGRGGPRDLAALRDGLRQARAIEAALTGQALPPDMLMSHLNALRGLERVLDVLNSALNDTVGMHARDGGFIKEGYDKTLDEYRDLAGHGNERKERLRARYAQDTEITSLKIKENNVLGHFIEITPQHLKKIPDGFVHRQTLANAVRFTTPELRELEQAIIHAKSDSLERELALFQELAALVHDRYEALLFAARALAHLDVFAALAALAQEKRYCRPVVEDSAAFDIRSGRHPVVESALKEPFIANDCDLAGHRRIWLITGPNMAGKSTFLRQNALIAILAQMGSYVPADQARVGLVDRVFSRVGAADDLARGQSTFMVEMLETATILHQATSRSLVILDEIGRGTATFDGLSIAWAVLEHLHDTVRCRTLFATHYHELTSLEHRLKALSCHTVKVREWKGQIVFLHSMEPGAALGSYGIQVAKLAGLPPKVIARSEQIMEFIQNSETQQTLSRLSDDLPLFAGSKENVKIAPRPADADGEAHPLVKRLRALNLDELTPKDALNELYALYSLLPE